MRKLLVLLMVCALGVGAVVLADDAAASSGSGDYGPSGYGPGLTCPDGYQPDGEWCVMRTVEFVDAEQIVELVCPSGFDGPDYWKLCSRVVTETFPATPIVEYTCPPGFDGPDAALVCSRTVDTVEIVHVDESSESVCPDGLTEIVDRLETRCAYETMVERTSAPAVDTILTCPDDAAGPTAAGECVRSTIETAPAIPSSDVLCPDGFAGPDAGGVCSIDVPDLEIKGAEVDIERTCFEGFELFDDRCIRNVPAGVAFECPPGFEPNPFDPTQCNDPTFTLPPTQAVLVFVCDAPLTGPFFPGGPSAPGVCLETFTPIDSAIVSCPDGFEGPDMMHRCTRVTTTTITVPAVVLDTARCPRDFVGPDAAGTCFRIGEDRFPATTEPVAACALPALGPNADGVCVEWVPEQRSVPAVERPTFSCPVGYDGPDADWNCSRPITVTETEDATERIVRYACPSDADGPDADDQCTRMRLETQPATREVTLHCPEGEGPNAAGQCAVERLHRVRPSGHDCTVHFYDYPNGKKRLFSDDGGAHDLHGPRNNDIESIEVPWGCTVSVADHHDGGGWCLTFGPGLHDVPDDEISWYSIPGTDCYDS